ncbi:MAG: hypothetical protein NTV96_03355 [Actinobacteria bacterium]|nr:hypothetical protein [Actinomycetota bacterium]
MRAESKSRKATVALVLAVISLVAAPALLWAELIVLYLGGWISSEPEVPIFVVAIVIVVICLALLIVFALPVAAPCRAPCPARDNCWGRLTVWFRECKSCADSRRHHSRRAAYWSGLLRSNGLRDLLI